jgi:alkylhydroperoxidase family enzyme
LQQEADAAKVDGFCGERLVEAVVRDLEGSPLPEKEKALLRFVGKVNHESVSITPADMQPLYAAGWTDEAIYYAITICALFNFYNRWVDAAGVPALSDEAHCQNAKRSAAMGYVRK